MQKMNKKIAALLTMCMLFALNAYGQTETGAKLVAKIKRDKNYISAEATDSTVEAASATARAELMQFVDEYIVSQNMATDAKQIIVRNIGKNASEVKLMRGTMHRVFVYVLKTDIMASKGDTEVLTIGGNTAANTTAAKATPAATATTTEKAAKDELTSTVETIDVIDTTAVAPKTAIADTTAVAAKTTAAATPVTTVTETTVAPATSATTTTTTSATATTTKAAEKEADVDMTIIPNAYFDKLPEYRQRVITDLQKTNSLSKALEILNENKQLGYVRNYGNAESCKNANASYWVLYVDGLVTVLSPVKADGTRIVVATGITSTFGSLSDGLWFRF